VRSQQAERLHTFSAAHAGAYKSTNYLVSINLKLPLEGDNAQRGPEFRTLNSEMDFSCSAWRAHNVNQKFPRFPVSPSLFGILRGMLRSFKNSGDNVGFVRMQLIQVHFADTLLYRAPLRNGLSGATQWRFNRHPLNIRGSRHGEACSAEVIQHKYFPE